jgi:hypothetical protein
VPGCCHTAEASIFVNEQDRAYVDSMLTPRLYGCFGHLLLRWSLVAHHSAVDGLVILAMGFLRLVPHNHLIESQRASKMARLQLRIRDLLGS